MILRFVSLFPLAALMLAAFVPEPSWFTVFALALSWLFMVVKFLEAKHLIREYEKNPPVTKIVLLTTYRPWFTWLAQPASVLILLYLGATVTAIFFLLVFLFSEFVHFVIKHDPTGNKRI